MDTPTTGTRLYRTTHHPTTHNSPPPHPPSPITLPRQHAQFDINLTTHNNTHHTTTNNTTQLHNANTAIAPAPTLTPTWFTNLHHPLQ
jgi:hypothetical protein